MNVILKEEQVQHLRGDDLMKDITNNIMQYREATRHIWNTYFIGKVKSIQECGLLDYYEEIDKNLFYAIVLEAIDRGSYKIDAFRSQPISILRVIIKEEIDKLSIIISHSKNQTYKKWNEPIVLSSIEKAEFLFIECFEWDRYSYASYPYYLVRIKKFPKYPHLVGEDALIETHHARVYYVDI